MEEYIIAPAIKKGDEVKISRFCHAELINNDGFFKGAEQGFITSFNRFVDRKEALKIAKQNNENLNKLCDSNELYSEDLFMNEHELINKNKELEKVVELMAEWISNNCFYSDAYSNSCEIIQDSCYKNLDCKKCIIDYFKKKARDDNG